MLHKYPTEYGTFGAYHPTTTDKCCINIPQSTVHKHVQTTVARISHGLVHLKPIADKCCMNIPWTGASETYRRQMLHEYLMDYGASEAYHR